MVQGKIAGVVIGGFTGYLLLSKAMNVINSSIKNVCRATEWKNYYKYGKDNDMVPPGYNQTTRYSDGREVTVEGPKTTSENTSQTQNMTQITNAVVDAINDTFKGSKTSKGAVEARETHDINEECDKSENEEEIPVKEDKNEDLD